MRDELSGVLGDDKHLLWFPYDWRYDIKDIAKWLDERIKNDWRETLRGRRVIIIAHSMGGLVAWTWKNLYYRNLAESYDFNLWRLVLLGTPLEGSCEMLRMLLSGYLPVPGASVEPVQEFGYRLLFGELRAAAYTMPSVFELLPLVPKGGELDLRTSCLVVDMPQSGETPANHFDLSIWDSRVLPALESSNWFIRTFLPWFAKRSVWEELGMSRPQFLEHLRRILERGREFRDTLDLSEDPVGRSRERDGLISRMLLRRRSLEQYRNWFWAQHDWRPTCRTPRSGHFWSGWRGTTT